MKLDADFRTVDLGVKIKLGADFQSAEGKIAEYHHRTKAQWKSALKLNFTDCFELKHDSMQLCHHTRRTASNRDKIVHDEIEKMLTAGGAITTVSSAGLFL